MAYKKESREEFFMSSYFLSDQQAVASTALEPEIAKNIYEKKIIINMLTLLN